MRKCHWFFILGIYTDRFTTSSSSLLITKITSLCYFRTAFSGPRCICLMSYGTYNIDMKKIFLSFFIIVTFALFATFSRRNVGIGADRFLAPSVSIFSTIPSSPSYIPKRTIGSDDENDSDDGNTPTVAPPTTAPAPAPVNTGQYKDGSYTGVSSNAYYGYIQVKAVIQGGKLADVVFLSYPNDRRTSIEINSQAMPYLKSEAIQAQSGNVNIVSGATDSSIAFRESMSSALAQAIQ